MVSARTVLAALIGALALAPARAARAYEFDVHARTIGQGYQLRTFRLSGGGLRLSRRRFTQSLALEIWDIGDLAAHREARGGRRRGGPRVYLSTYLRLDHDFGDWTMGTLDDPRFLEAIDANDAIPELASSSLALDIMYAYLGVDGIADGRLDLRLGRQVTMDPLDAVALDGATAVIHTPWHASLEVQGGLRVRDASPVAPDAYELDGTTGADCREYVEGAQPGTGSWQIIDRSRVPGDSPFTADLDYCPQRLEPMPTVGVAVATEGLRRVDARLSYRRSMSRTPGLIGAVDRLDYPDLGVYPDEAGQAPAWGTNEERLALRVAGKLAAAGVELRPWVGARWSLIHATVDEAIAAVRLRRGAHALEPEVARHVPTFDADSIWSVFVVDPSTDLRLGWDYTPRGRWRGHAEAWARR
ncbi:MAG: hypothetical protein KC464_22520, partial [Myxococcales bacterium]|nr:hypothetical protein [Myxococcales bacterium]